MRLTMASIRPPVPSASPAASTAEAARFFEEGGSADHLADPSLAAELRDAHQDGAEFIAGGRYADTLTPLEAYQTLMSPNPHANRLYLGLRGIQMVACDRESLTSGRAAFAPLLSAHREVLRPAAMDAYSHECALDRIAGQRTPQTIRQHAELLVDLHGAARDSGAHEPATDTLGNSMVRLYDVVTPHLTTLPEAALRTGDVVAWTRRGGADQAREAVAVAWTGALDAAHYQDFNVLMTSLGHVPTVQGALAAVEAGHVGSRAGRMASLTRVAELRARGGDANGTVTDFQAVMDAARDDTSLAQATDRFVKVWRALQPHDLQARSAECFQALESHWRTNDTSHEHAYMTFEDHVKRQRDIDLGILARPRAAAGTIEHHDEVVIVGGVRLPRNPSL